MCRSGRRPRDEAFRLEPQVMEKRIVVESRRLNSGEQ
jgi:hypothetical protein